MERVSVAKWSAAERVSGVSKKFLVPCYPLERDSTVFEDASTAVRHCDASLSQRPNPGWVLHISKVRNFIISLLIINIIINLISL